MPLHLLAAFVVCFAAFFRGDWKRRCSAAGCSSPPTLMGGLLTAVYTLSGNTRTTTAVYAEIGAGSLVAVALASALCAWVFGFLSKRRLKSLYADVEIVFGGGRYTLRLLADSGNLLREPISGLPVILLRPGVLPGGEPLTLERPGQRVIPFYSAGGSDILIGFRADSITLKTLTRKKDIQAYRAFDKAGNGFAGTDGLFPASLL
ncbi:MAG: sigma-E processing peptidase SpoIIGA [Acutalibacteraceae bacterium]